MTVIDTAQPTASVASVLSTLTVARITELAREAGLAPTGRRKDEVVESVAKTGRIRFRALLAQLRRDELQAACREHRLPDSGRARQELMQRLLQSHGAHDSAPPPPLFSGTPPERKVPRPGDTIVARHRQWLVGDVKLPPNEGDATWVELTCLDDDHRGQPLELLWELELGAKVIDPEAHGLGEAERLDPPRHFGAFLHALRWQGVTASDKNYFQAPFRAGIEVLAHQLTPLQKALSLPRANLFIADDVGLGKTIEAGLVLQELLLRQRVEFTLIVAPASVTLQWQGEMEQRFGLRFEIYSREFVLARRQERGFGINPWTTHTRFIISYPLLRRPEYRDPLLAHLGALSQSGSQSSSRAKKSLLILDEAHTAAPASGGRYAVDSQTTHVVRDIAPRFENRLFLSATPHNGHSNSFSALLEILDPQRFTRGVPVRGREQLREVMVRRLKRDLRQLTHSMRFPERKVVRIAIDMEPAEGNEPNPNELNLAKTLAEYTSLFAELPKTKRLPLINLQKRLLSSVEAFARTLGVHAKSKQRAVAAIDSDEEADAEHTLGLDDDALDEREEQRVASASAALHKVMPEGAEALLASMHDQAEQLRREPDAKVRALMDWMREQLCPAIGDRDSKDTMWTDRRVLIFTEYGDTRRYLMGLLREAVRHTDGGEDRVDQIHGGMNEQAREEVQYAFNAAPDGEPLRILVATDAAREGLNLQAHCADLFHFDIPWNPSRMEQRNGRIDRALQPSPEVRCHYFVYESRPEDRVLEKVVEKTEVISRELGSLGQVVRERIANALDPGIGAATEGDVDKASDLGNAQGTADDELEASREQKELQREMDRALRTYTQSQKRLNFRPEHLRDALDVGLELFGAEAIAEIEDEAGVFALPELPDHWQATLDALRPPRGREQAWHEWRDQAPRPVVFKAPQVLTQSKVHLHLEHPFVQRVLGRFLAQGFGHHDLSRVTAVAMPDTGDTVALAIGRLCLFGSGAGRLHDALLAVAARVEGSRLSVLDTRDSEAQLAALEKRLEEAPTLEAFAPKLRDELVGKARGWMDELRPALRQEADAMAVEIELKLKARAKEEAEALTRILESQREAIGKTLGGKQLRLDFGSSEAEQRQAKQVERDRRYLEGRLTTLDRELETEPAELAAIYDVKLRRFEPVGLVVLYPELLLR